MEGLVLQFEWDPTKASLNAAKHGVSFDVAATVFLDPLAMTIHDDEHSEDEERWITMGHDREEVPVVVVHTFEHLSPASAHVRLISARRPTKAELREYQEQPE